MSLPVEPNIAQGQIALDPVNGIVWYVDSEGNKVSTTWSWLRPDLAEVETDDNVTITGNLTVQGTTVTVDAETIIIQDNFILVNSTNGSATSATAGLEVERGALNNVQLRWNEAIDTWQYTNDGITFYDINSIIANSVQLGYHTTGNYVEDLTSGTGVTIISGTGEGSNPTISIGQDVSTSATPVFSRIIAPVTGNVTGTVSDISNHSFNELSDITISFPENGDFLRYDGLQWINDAVNLSTDTVGEYVSTVIAGSGILVSNSGGEGSTPQVILNASLDNLSDVIISSATPNQVLRFDGSNWINQSLSEAYTLNELSGVVITSPEEFQTLEYDGTNWVNKHASVVSYVRNAESTTITTGTVVYLFGSTGDHATVKRADNSSDTTSSKTVGVVAANILANENGPVITRGYVDGIDLSTGYTAGDVLWLGSNGNFTKTKPSAPQHLVFIGVVVRATNNGIIYVATQNGYELDELHDVSITSKIPGDFLKYNGSLWVNDQINLGTDTVGSYVSQLSSGSNISITNNSGEGSTPNISWSAFLNDLSDVIITGAPILNQVLVYNGLSWVNGSSPGGSTSASPTVEGTVFGRTVSASGITFLGHNSGNSTSTSMNNIAIGSNALQDISSGANNTAIGYSALGNVTSGGFNVGIGMYAQANVTSGQHNIAIGYSSLYGGMMVTGNYNIALGHASSYSMSNGSSNISLGFNAMTSLPSGNQNIAIGENAMSSVSVGANINHNIAIGTEALKDSVNFTSNIAIGQYAMTRTKGTSNSIAIGKFALSGSSFIDDNTGGPNIAIGVSSLMGISSGYSNVGLGAYAGYSVSIGQDNTFIGFYASGITTGINNTIIGYNAQASSATINNEFTLGNSSITNLRCNDTTISSLSDLRDKSNIEEIPLGLDYIRSMRPVMFDWERRDGSFKGKKDFGFIAQELDKLEEEFGYKEYTRLVHKDNPEKWEADPMKTYPIIVKAIQELAISIDEIKERLKDNF